MAKKSSNQKAFEESVKETQRVVSDTFRSLSADLQAQIKDLISNTRDEAEKITLKLEGRDLSKEFKNLLKSTEKLDENIEKMSKGQMKSKELTAQITELQGRRENLQEALNVLKARQVELGEEDAFNLEEVSKLLEEQLSTQEKIAKTVDKNTSGFTTLSKVVRSIPGLRGLAEPFEKAAEASKAINFQKSINSKSVNMFTGLGTGLKVLAGSIAGISAVATVIAGIFEFIKDAVFGISEENTNLAKTMGTTALEAGRYREQLEASYDRTGETLETTSRLIEAHQELAKAAGATRGFKVEELQAQVMLTKQVGMQLDVAAKLANLARINDQTAEDILDATLDQTVALLTQTGIQLDNRQVMEDISAVSGQVAANLKNNPTLIAQAVVQARRFGLTLDQVATIGQGLLNFQESIGAELEAELLTGKALNLENARYYALKGDIVGLTKEIAEQARDLGGYEKMSVLAQQSLAKALGMSADQLGDMLRTQENLSKLGSEELKKLDDQRDKYEAVGITYEEALAKAAKGGLEAVNAQVQFEEALIRAKAAFADLFSDPEQIERLVDSFKIFGEVLISIAKTTEHIINDFRLMYGLGQTVVGGLLSLGNPLDPRGREWMKEGVGTMKENFRIFGSYPFAEDKEEIEAKDFTIRTHPKDTLVMAGGTKLGGDSEKTNMLLERLISAVEKGGDVYMDGNKVGEALVIGNRRLS